MMQSGQSSLIGVLEGRLIHSKSLSIKKELSPLQKPADSTSLSDALLNNAQEDARALTS
jgi:hypothetical protein